MKKTIAMPAKKVAIVSVTMAAYALALAYLGYANRVGFLSVMVFAVILGAVMVSNRRYFGFTETIIAVVLLTLAALGLAVFGGENPRGDDTRAEGGRAAARVP